MHHLTGKRVTLINPGGYEYGGTVTSQHAEWGDDWVNVDWDVKVHPCTTPIQARHLRLVRTVSQATAIAGCILGFNNLNLIEACDCCGDTFPVSAVALSMHGQLLCPKCRQESPPDRREG